MQREEWADAGQSLYLPGCPKGDGGNSTLTNQREDDIIPMSWESIPCEETGYAESFECTQGVYRHGPYQMIPYDRGASDEQMVKERHERAEEGRGLYGHHSSY